MTLIRFRRPPGNPDHPLPTYATPRAPAFGVSAAADPRPAARPHAPTPTLPGAPTPPAHPTRGAQGAKLFPARRNGLGNGRSPAA